MSWAHPAFAAAQSATLCSQVPGVGQAAISARKSAMSAAGLITMCSSTSSCVSRSSWRSLRSYDCPRRLHRITSWLGATAFVTSY